MRRHAHAEPAARVRACGACAGGRCTGPMSVACVTSRPASRRALRGRQCLEQGPAAGSRGSETPVFHNYVFSARKKEKIEEFFSIAQEPPWRPQRRAMAPSPSPPPGRCACAARGGLQRFHPVRGVRRCNPAVLPRVQGSRPHPPPAQPSARRVALRRVQPHLHGLPSARARPRFS